MTLESPPWTIRIERREVKDEERPVAVIVDGAAQTLRARSSLIQGNVEEGTPITISLYPEVIPAAAKADAFRERRQEATKLKQQMIELLNTGLTVTSEEDDRTRNWAGPLAIPLWDYAGVPLTGKEKAGPADPHDVMWVEEGSINVQAQQDIEDPGRWMVFANFRVTVERPGRVPSEDETMTVTKVVGHYGGERH